jgi:hypothetical protein
MAKPASTAIDGLPAFYKSGDLNVIIETPKGDRNKFKYEPELGLFLINKVLPAGAVFPFDFGFVPATLGEDGDPLDTGSDGRAGIHGLPGAVTPRRRHRGRGASARRGGGHSTLQERSKK